MGDADPISQPCTPTLSDPIPIETAPTEQLSYWQRNLRRVLDQSSATLDAWLHELPVPKTKLLLDHWGPPAPRLSHWFDERPALAEGGVRIVSVLRFLDPAELTAEALATVESKAPIRLYLLQRSITRVDRLASDSRPPVAQDPILALRKIHLHTRYTLSRKKEFARRGANLHLAEFALSTSQPPI